MAVLTWPPPENDNTTQPPATTLTPTQVLDPTNPIDPARFATALKDLPLDALHAKAAEIRNSIMHLRHSNEQMLPFAEEGDDDCREAMFENLQVITRINERLQLVKREVEGRGVRWVGHVEDLRSEGNDADDDAQLDEAMASGRVIDFHEYWNRTNGNGNGNGSGATSGEVSATPAPSGRLTDEELRRQLAAQMGEDDDDDGVHL